eukprot:GILJ01014432.1.p1 GENE.GILJ01014432.1~~GILJ01014432.1.p1  ORF type:complete len:142 (-),score=8.18 GILJ01014432.1:7-432(-)
MEASCANLILEKVKGPNDADIGSGTADLFTSALAKQLLSLPPLSPPPIGHGELDKLNIHLTLRNASWDVLVAVCGDDRWYVFKNWSTNCLGWVPFTYELEERCKTHAPFSRVYKVKENDEWYRCIVALRKSSHLSLCQSER